MGSETAASDEAKVPRRTPHKTTSSSKEGQSKYCNENMKKHINLSDTMLNKICLRKSAE